MKILLKQITSPHRQSHHTAADYMTDSLFHGLRTLWGEGVVDGTRLWQMYKSESDPAKMAKLHGKGFTLYGLLGDDSRVDRTDIPAKIAARYFDFVVVTVHCSAAGPDQRELVEKAIDDLAAHYPRNQIAFVEGLDSDSFVYNNVFPRVVYFKRESTGAHPTYPVSFSIPREKIVIDDRRPKTAAFAWSLPWNETTKSFKTEGVYYQDYSTSHFGHTCRKGGWDSLRHYEIIANGCLPWFHDIGKCPEKTLFTFPKGLCQEVLMLSGVHSSGDITSPFFKWGTIDRDRFNVDQYEVLRARFLLHAMRNLTTESMARYVIDTMISEKPRHGRRLV